MKDWLERLDDRIDRCPGCDEWRWDQHCERCEQQPSDEERPDAHSIHQA